MFDFTEAGVTPEASNVVATFMLTVPAVVVIMAVRVAIMMLTGWVY